MPRARRARKKASNAVVEFEKEVKTVLKELEHRYDAVCRNAKLPSDESVHLFRAMLAYALSSDYDTFVHRRKRVANKDEPQAATATTSKRGILEPDVTSPAALAQKVTRKLTKQIISVSSDDKPELSPTPVQKKSRRKKAVSIVQLDDTPVLQKNSKSKLSSREMETEQAESSAMDVEPAAKKGSYLRKSDMTQESQRVELPKSTESLASDENSTVVVLEIVDSPDRKQSEKKENIANPVTDDGKQRKEAPDAGDSMHEDKENRFAVSKNGKLSDAAIKRFKKPTATDAKPNEGVGKSVRLFKPALRPAGKRAQTGVKERRTEAEMRLAAKTPGMGKLAFGNVKAAASAKPAMNTSSDVTADIIALSLKSPGRNARKKISFAPNLVELEAPPASEPLPDRVEDKEEDKVLPVAEGENQDEPSPGLSETGEQDAGIIRDEKTETSHEKGRVPAVQEEVEQEEIVATESTEKAGQDETVVSVEDEPQPKRKFSIEPLFPPSIFAAASPTPKKKSISFAPGTKKRSSDSLEPQEEPGTSSKRARPTTLTGKSDLRKRIDSMRERMSQKSMGSPSQRLLTYSPNADSTHPASQETDSSGYLSAKSRAKCSSSEGDDVMEVVHPSDHHTPRTGTAHRTSDEQFKHSPTPDRSLSIKTPARALEERFNASSPENTTVAEAKIAHIQVQQDGDGDAVMKGVPGGALGAQQSGGPGVLSNLMTSVKSFLPSAMAIPGFQAVEKEETEEEKAKRLERERKEDEERREAETIARREAAKQVRQAEAREKQRRVEEKRRALELEMQRKEEEKRQKEVARTQRLRQENEERKRKKAEEDRKRELKRQRVRAHQEKAAAEEAAKRAALEKKLAAARMAQAAKLNAKLRVGGSSKAPLSERKAPLSARKGLATPGAERQLFKKKSVEVTSYEMSADRERANYSDDSSSECEEVKARRKGKKIPDWATKNNVAKAVNLQRADPDKHFTRIQGVNLEDVFASTNQQKMRYRSRNSSGQWTKDRLTAKEEMEYKKKSGYI